MRGQQLKLNALALRHAELQEEVTALRDCLCEGGNLSQHAVSVRIHRRRFADALARHPLRGISTVLEAVLHTGELAQAVATLGGAESISPLSSASHALGRAVKAVAIKLSEHFPPSLYIVGGCCHEIGVLDTVECLDLASGAWTPVAP